MQTVKKERKECSQSEAGLISAILSGEYFVLQNYFIISLPMVHAFICRIPMYDYQGICEIWVKGGSGASSLFLDVS